MLDNGDETVDGYGAVFLRPVCVARLISPNPSDL